MNTQLPAPEFTVAAGPSMLPTDYIFRPVLSGQVDLETGRQYRFSGRWEATSESGSLMGCRIEAYPLGATSAEQRIRSTLATRNHEGEANGLAFGTKRAIGNEWLFEPPATGTYVVELRGQAGKCLVGADPANPGDCVTQPQHQLNLVDGPNTFLRLADVSYAGGCEWQQLTQPDGDVHFGNPNGSPARARAVDVLWRTVELPAGTQLAHIWTGTGISVESTGGAAPLSVRLTSYARQLTDTGAFCKVQTHTTTGTINGDLHHYRFNQIQKFELDPACGTTKVNVKVYVEYLAAPGGQPERHGGVVHGGPYTGAHVIPIG